MWCKDYSGLHPQKRGSLLEMLSGPDCHRQKAMHTTGAYETYKAVKSLYSSVPSAGIERGLGTVVEPPAIV